MPDSTNANRGWFRYTDNKGNHWAMKVQKNWGENSESGFVTYGGTGHPAYGDDPPFPLGIGRNRPRTILCELIATGTVQTTVGFRKTRVRVGAATAEAWTNGAYVFESSAKGIAGAVNYQVVGYSDEHMLVAHPITQLPEPIGP
jgi:hypothetical protein